jgi:hypothetical protein
MLTEYREHATQTGSWGAPSGERLQPTREPAVDHLPAEMAPVPHIPQRPARLDSLVCHRGSDRARVGTVGRPGNWLDGWMQAIGLAASGILAQAVATAPILAFLGLPIPFAFMLPAGITAHLAITSASV